MAAFSGKNGVRLALAALLTFVVPACGTRVRSLHAVWLNPAVGDRCEQLRQVKEIERPAGTLPDDFPLPDGASVAGAAPGNPVIVRVTVPGGFLALDSFFKSELENRGWAGGSSGNGADVSGRYGYVQIDGHGWKGEVAVIQCGDLDPEVLIELERFPGRN